MADPASDAATAPDTVTDPGNARARRVVVTGGASGIGRAAAVKLAGQGARVVVLDVDDAAAGSLGEPPPAGRPGIGFIHADVSNEAETEAAMGEAAERLGGIDVLIVAAGIMRGQLQPLTELDAATWERVVAVNLGGTLNACRAAARSMIPAGAGVIILVSSKGGVSVGSGSYAYGASKGGMHGLALTLERHLGPRGIRVNEVCPGDVDTALFRRSVAEGVARGGDPAAAEALLARLTPAEDVAEVLAFLASGAASAVRGTVFTA
jgi:NAD(P)-dependent dehydrogenase (short-subunit alcohol dehydrogenase family)